MAEQRERGEGDGGERAQEWGQRQEAGKEIARGGKEGGCVPGAEPDRTPPAEERKDGSG